MYFSDPLSSWIQQISNQIQSTQYQWYVYTMPVSGTGELALVNSNDTANYIDEVVIYNDDCNNLTVIDQVHITGIANI